MTPGPQSTIRTVETGPATKGDRLVPGRRSAGPVRRILLLTAALLASACYDSRFEEPETQPADTGEAVVESIEWLSEHYAGTPFVVETDIAVTGTVTTSDRAENFYRTICIEEHRSALEILAGADRLHNEFPEGCRVTVRLKGLVVTRSRGVIQVGKIPQASSGYDADYIGSKAALDKILVRNSEEIEPVVPAPLTIPELTPERCGTLVQIEGLHYLPEELSDAAWRGYKRFADQNGRFLYTYVRNYAAFADNEVPTGNVALVGILQYDDSGEGRFLIKMRDENDCLH